MGEGLPRSIRDCLVNVLAGRPEVRLAYLFGSLSRGTGSARSDIDVAVLVSHDALHGPWPGIELALLDALAVSLPGKSIDLVLLNVAPPVLAREVVACGEVLVERRRDERLLFELDTQRRYLDTAPLRRIRDGGVARRLVERTAGAPP